MAASSPIIGGYLYGIAPHLTFYYIAALFAAAILVLLVVPLQSADDGAHGHEEHGDGAHRPH